MLPAIWSSQLMEQVIGAIKNEKISSGVLVLLMAGVWYVHGWAGEEFVKKGEFSKLQTTVTDGFESIEINDAAQIIRDIKLEVLITKATDGSESDKTRLAGQLGDALAYRQCLIERKPNCQHLKTVE